MVPFAAVHHEYVTDFTRQQKASEYPEMTLWECAQKDICVCVHNIVSSQSIETKLQRLIQHNVGYTFRKGDENWLLTFCVNGQNVGLWWAWTPCTCTDKINLMTSISHTLWWNISCYREGCAPQKIESHDDQHQSQHYTIIIDNKQLMEHKKYNGIVSQFWFE